MNSSEPRRERRKIQYPRDLPAPRQWLHFVQLDPFPPAWERLGLDDDDLRALEVCIMVGPATPPIVPGTGGVRKLRFAPARWSRGKRGAARVYYAWFPASGTVALIYAHSKAEAETIAEGDKRTIKKLIEEIETYLERGKGSDRQ